MTAQLDAALRNKECACEHPVIRHTEGELLGHPGKFPCTVFGCPCTDYAPAQHTSAGSDSTEGGRS